jgi:hypothetical protein
LQGSCVCIIVCFCASANSLLDSGFNDIALASPYPSAGNNFNLCTKDFGSIFKHDYSGSIYAFQAQDFYGSYNSADSAVKPKLLGESINKIVRKAIGGDNKILGEMLINWHRIVGEEIAEATLPRSIFSAREKGRQINILYININNAAYGLKIAYQQEIIIEKIAIYFGYKAVHKIRTKIVS